MNVNAGIGCQKTDCIAKVALVAMVMLCLLGKPSEPQSFVLGRDFDD